MVISAALLLAVVAMKFLFPAALERCRATLLELLGADTDFVEVFSAAGRAFSSGSDALTDAYTARVRRGGGACFRQFPFREPMICPATWICSSAFLNFDYCRSGAPPGTSLRFSAPAAIRWRAAGAFTTALT